MEMATSAVAISYVRDQFLSIPSCFDDDTLKFLSTNGRRQVKTRIMKWFRSSGTQKEIHGKIIIITARTPLSMQELDDQAATAAEKKVKPW